MNISNDRFGLDFQCYEFLLGSLEALEYLSTWSTVGVDELSTKNLNIGILGGALAIALTAVFILIVMLCRKKKTKQNEERYRIEVEPTSN